VKRTEGRFENLEKNNKEEERGDENNWDLGSL